jgi:hypothetical protein
MALIISTFSSEMTIAKMMDENNCDNLLLGQISDQQQKQSLGSSGMFWTDGSISEKTINNINNTYSGILALPYVYFPRVISLKYKEGEDGTDNIASHAFLVAASSDVEKTGYHVHEGSLEITSDSIYITDYLAWQILENDFYYTEGETEMKLTNASSIYDLTGKQIYRYNSFSPEQKNDVLKIAGIVDTDYDSYQNRTLSGSEQEVFKFMRRQLYLSVFCTRQYIIDAINVAFFIDAKNFPIYTKKIGFTEGETEVGQFQVWKNENFYDPDFLSEEFMEKTVALSIGLYNKIFHENKSKPDYYDIVNREVIELPEHIGETIDLNICDQSGTLLKFLNGYKIVGVNINVTDPVMYVMESDFEYLKPIGMKIDKLFINASSNNYKENSQFLEEMRKLDFFSQTVFSEQIYLFETTYKHFSYVFYYGALILMAFSMLLIMNFIMVNIEMKKKEIGLLRALGARLTDVIRIFVIEGLMISLILMILTIPLLFVGIDKINTSFKMPEGLSLLSVEFSSIMIVALVILIVIFISSILPVNKIGRLKPVEALKANN